ncbi:MAG: ribulose-phosphate 3-epimerase [Dissulfurispiraceae bacterium]
MEIVPALLAENFEDFLVRLKKAEVFARYVQIDLMDGLFVKTESFPAQKLNTIKTSLSFEVHLMVEDPAAHASSISNASLEKVVFHYESRVDHRLLIAAIRKRGLKAGLAIKPETALKQWKGLAQDIDTLLFLTVDPGSYGSPFKPEVLGKIAEARQLFPDKVIGVDGGVSLDNLETFGKLGVDYICVGSRIFLSEDPEKSYRLFLDRVAHQTGEGEGD